MITLVSPLPAMECGDEKGVDVYEAVDSRRAVRAFSDEPVPKKEGVPRLRTGRADMTETVSFIGV
nr:hypothetical protein [Streptomyces adelaidensis]